MMMMMIIIIAMLLLLDYRANNNSNSSISNYFVQDGAWQNRKQLGCQCCKWKRKYCSISR